MERDASISQCGKYRYLLTREWNPDLPKCTFGMVNPSTADANIDDATIRKCIGFATRNGFGGFMVWNLFAWRATDVKDLKFVADPIGEKNDIAIQAAFMSASTHFAAWGSITKIPIQHRDRVNDVVEAAHHAGVSFLCLSTTKFGDPCHPLMLPYESIPVPWPLDM